MKRVYNFSAGPSMLPQSVLEQAAAEMLDYKGTGQSVMEMSHRSKAYKPIIDSCEALLRELMNIPSNYKVLFLQGGASMQFSMIPLNLKKKAKPPILTQVCGQEKLLKKQKNGWTLTLLLLQKIKHTTIFQA